MARYELEDDCVFGRVRVWAICIYRNRYVMMRVRGEISNGKV